MTKEKVGNLVFGMFILVSACTYTAPSQSTGGGSEASSSVSGSGQGGMGTGGNDATSSSGSGQGGKGGAAASSSSGAGGGASTSSSSSSSGGMKVEVNCGGVVCDPAQFCCIKPGVPPFYSCASTGTCENVEVQCDGPEDCSAGFVCCGSVDINGNFLKLHCAVKCGAAESQICNTEKMPTTCPDPLGCSALPPLGAPYGACE